MPAGAGRPAVGTLTRPLPPPEEPTEPRGGRAWPWRTLLAIAGGLVLGLAFPGYDLVGLAVVGPAALAFAVHRQRVRAGLDFNAQRRAYVKRHPVPLAEYVPARSFFRFFSDKVSGSATSSASRWSTTAWWTTSSTAGPG